MKYFLRTVICALIISAGLYTAQIIWCHAHIRAAGYYDPAPSLAVHVDEVEDKNGLILERFSFEARPGQKVPVMAALPATDSGPFPAVIFLYGIGMKATYDEQIAGAVTRAGFALFAPEQAGCGQRKEENAGAFREALALRRRILATIQEPRRLIDVLQSRPDIDDQRIYLWGASFGAMTGCILMAHEPRLQAGILTLAGGDFRKMIRDSSYFKSWKKGWLQQKATPLLATLLKPFDPIHYAGLITPRPLLFQNLADDDLIPRSSTEALYQAAGEPKRIIWYMGPHNHPLPETIRQVLSDGLKWLKEMEKQQ